MPPSGNIDRSDLQLHGKSDRILLFLFYSEVFRILRLSKIELVPLEIAHHRSHAKFALLSIPNISCLSMFQIIMSLASEVFLVYHAGEFMKGGVVNKPSKNIRVTGILFVGFQLPWRSSVLALLQTLSVFKERFNS